jgi:Uma2 family endonuclease
MESAHVAVLSPSAPQRLKMTYEEYLALPEDGKLIEWVNGEVIVHMPPTIRHQLVVGFLFALLKLVADHFRLGVVIPAPAEMKLTPDGPAREPDILFIANENLARLSSHRLNGPADLVVEVISDESASRDQTDKFYEYQAAGVQEYWLIDPRMGKQRVDVWALGDDGRYQPILPDDVDIYRSSVLPSYWLRETWLYAAPMPDRLTTFAEIVGLPSDLTARLRQPMPTDAS